MVRTCCRCHKVIKILFDPTISVEIFHSENDTNEKFYVCQECYESLLAYLTTNPEETEAHPVNENIAKGFEEFTKMMFKQGQAESEDKK